MYEWAQSLGITGKSNPLVNFQDVFSCTIPQRRGNDIKKIILYNNFNYSTNEPFLYSLENLDY